MRYKTIELGCGNVLDLRFDIRADVQRTSATNVIADIRNLFHVPAKQYSYAKLAAVLEHITPEEQVRAARGLHHILIPHGLCWITTPDKQWIEDALTRGDITQEWHDTLIRGGEIDEFDHHRGLLNAEEIEHLFVSNGFSVVWGRDGNQSGGSLDFVFERGG